MIDERAGEDVRGERIAELQLPRLRNELLGKSIEQPAMHQQPTGRHAALAGGLERAQDAGVDGQRQIGVLADDHGAFRAHLQAHVLWSASAASRRICDPTL